MKKISLPNSIGQQSAVSANFAQTDFLFNYLLLESENVLEVVNLRIIAVIS